MAKGRVGTNTMPVEFYLHPWIDVDERDDKGRGLHYQAIPNFLGLVNLQSKPQRLAGTGFAWSVLPAKTAHPDAIYMGDSPAGMQNKSAVETALGLGANEIVADNVNDALFELVTQHADPTKATRWGALQANSKGSLELVLGGLSLLRIERFDPRLHPLVLDVEREGYRYMRREALRGALRGADGKIDRQFHRRYLQGLVEKYRLPFQSFIPPGLPIETPLPHSTSISDDFNRTNESLDAGSWVEVGGDSAITDEEVSNTDASRAANRHTTALASAAHRAEVKIAAIGSSENLGPATRFSASANDGYIFLFDEAGADGDRIFEVTAGSLSQIAKVTHAVSVPQSVRGSSDGDTHTYFRPVTTSIVNVSDTTHQTNTSVGANASESTTNRWDDFVAADLEAAVEEFLAAVVLDAPLGPQLLPQMVGY